MISFINRSNSMRIEKSTP